MIQFRKYDRNDYEQISQFLTKHYQKNNQDGNLLKPLWEFIHKHPCSEMFQYDRIGIWEDQGEVVGFAHLESPFMGYVALEVHPNFAYLRKEMIEYSEKVLSGTTIDGQVFNCINVRENDHDLIEIVKNLGYIKQEGEEVLLLQYNLSTPLPKIPMPNGFKLYSLEEKYDLDKINKGLWKSFQYPGEPPVDCSRDLPRLHAFTNYNKDITVMIEAPNGELASFCGMWYDNVNKLAVLEPLATNPDFRRLGLGKAVVVEAINRCVHLGANTIYVYPTASLDFYQAIGFKTLHTAYVWKKVWDK